MLGAGSVGQILDRAAGGEVPARSLDVEDVQLIHPDVAGLHRGNGDRVVPAAIGGIPKPIGVAAHLVASAEAVGAGLRCIECRRVVAAAGIGHGVGLEVRVGVGRRDRVAIDRHDAVRDPIAIGIAIGTVAVIQIAEEFDRGHTVGPGRKGNRDRDRIARHFIDIELRRGVIAVERSVALGRDGENRRPDRADGKGIVGDIVRVESGEALFVVRRIPES